MTTYVSQPRSLMAYDIELGMGASEDIQALSDFLLVPRRGYVYIVYNFLTY